MSFYLNVSKQKITEVAKLSEQQKNQRADKINNRILKQTHDEKSTETLKT